MVGDWIFLFLSRAWRWLVWAEPKRQNHGSIFITLSFFGSNPFDSFAGVRMTKLDPRVLKRIEKENQDRQKRFSDYFLKNYPSGSHIHSPSWHAPKIYAASDADFIATAEATRAQKLVDFAQMFAGKMCKTYDSEGVEYVVQTEISRVASEALNEYFGTGDE